MNHFPSGGRQFRELAYFKCRFCRDAKKKCDPSASPDSFQCQRCKQMGLPCAPPTTAKQDRIYAITASEISAPLPPLTSITPGRQDGVDSEPLPFTVPTCTQSHADVPETLGPHLNPIYSSASNPANGFLHHPPQAPCWAARPSAPGHRKSRQKYQVPD
ncbi:hypothetical protein QBC34DRAFT_476981 [Podospora aff. communis PSN243]|uniref:Zn(2)-C6 fungal-type domain-containing protein n=1 Tax=Podospora aff. communis PSN243 TaxID=3040156 RepID=A0AAV9G608_9PEZI|nr:hypothetical protein QBC34DRAFT_476981 [Podospora aff. communis PSN243]